MHTRIAMWSGPRNISTAMMRAFENRPDTSVSDEPLYAHYLAKTGLAHPGAAEVIASQSTEWTSLTRSLVGTPPNEAPVWYQKHMTHHLLPGFDLSWVDDLHNCFLIRDPAEVVASYTRTRGTANLEDLGYPQQYELFQRLRSLTGESPLVLDAKDILQNPRRTLSALCEHLGLDMSDAMLAWPAGPRANDGVWGRFWYENVWASTGFQPYRAKTIDYAPRFQSVVDEAMPLYHALWEQRLK